MATPDRIALSDRVCTALQLVEHWQDVAEDFAAGRVYLPAEDMERFGVSHADLGRPRDGRGAARADGVRGARARGSCSTRARRSSARCAAARASRSRATSAAGARTPRRSSAPATTCSPGRRRPAARRASARRSSAGGTAGDGDAAAPAFEHVRRVARESGSSFYAGMRLLPPDKRDALFAIYALARRIDDIADGDLPADEKLAALGADARRAGARSARATTRCYVAVADAASRYPDPAGGVRRAGRGRRAGRARHRVRHLRRPRALLPLRRGLDRPALARRLRLLRPRAAARRSPTTSGSRCRSGTSCATCAEDVPNGRVYLPREDLERFGCAAVDGRIDGPVELLIAFEAQRALERLDRGLALVPLLDRRSASCVLAMTRQVRPAARADRGRPARRDARPAVAARLGEGARARARARGGEVTARDRRRRRRARGHRGGARLRGRGRGGDALRERGRGSAARRSRSSATAAGSTTASTSRCAAAPPTSRFLDRLGVAGLAPVQRRLRMPVLREGKPAAFISRNGMPAPLHLGNSLLRYPLLTAARAAVGDPRGARARRLDPDDPALDEQTLRRLAARARPEPGRDRRAVEPDRAADAEPARRRRLARRGGEGLPHGSARRERRRRHRRLDACRCSGCTATPATAALERAGVAAAARHDGRARSSAAERPARASARRRRRRGRRRRRRRAAPRRVAKLAPGLVDAGGDGAARRRARS